MMIVLDHYAVDEYFCYLRKYGPESQLIHSLSSRS